MLTEINSLCPVATSELSHPPQSKLIDDSIDFLKDIEKRIERFEHAQMIENIHVQNVQKQLQHFKNLATVLEQNHNQMI